MIQVIFAFFCTRALQGMLGGGGKGGNPGEKPEIYLKLDRKLLYLIIYIRKCLKIK